MKQISIKTTVLLASFLLMTGCKDYLDVVPEDVTSLEHTFSNRINAESFFYGCYYYLPDITHTFNSPNVLGGDEIWWDIDRVGFNVSSGAMIAQGQQNPTRVYQNFWDGASVGDGATNQAITSLWIGIRDCNIFIENIDNVPDMKEEEKVRWKAEVKFLKAYFHFYLMQLYGPIPIVDKNIEVGASLDEIRVYREPVDKVVDFIVNLLDEAIPDLPLSYEDYVTDVGRANKAIATAVKAKALIWAASPIFNGSAPYYQNFKDNRGVQLISNDNSAEAIRMRWERAAEAVKNAIDTCHLAGHSLYHCVDPVACDSIVRQKFTNRGASVRCWDNREIIFPYVGRMNPLSIRELSNYFLPNFWIVEGNISELCATLKMAETYYTRNGIPINEDPNWEYFGERNLLDTEINHSDEELDYHRFYIGENETTAKLNYFREPRFYAHLSFDRSHYESSSVLQTSTYPLNFANALLIQNRNGEQHGRRSSTAHIVTGYFVKKMVCYKISIQWSSPVVFEYTMPIIRLADLYLLYAEALNELDATPRQEVYDYIDMVRLRAGLKGVKESWAVSNNPNKPYNRETMREIIKRERLIELSFEGQRPFDLRRWLDAEEYYNQPVRGLNYLGSTPEDYYKEMILFNNRRFTYKEYLWPLRNSTLIKNGNLRQNPGW